MTELFQFTLFGLMLGCVYAIASMGLVLTYTVTGVFNFAHGAVGMIAAFVYFELRVDHDVPTPLALAIVVLVLAPLAGPRRRAAAAPVPGRRLRHLARRHRRAHRRPARPRPEGVPRGRGPQRPVPVRRPPHRGRSTCRSPTTASPRWSSPLLVAFGLRFLLFGTPLGARMRAVVDDRELARLNGVRSVARRPVQLDDRLRAGRARRRAVRRRARTSTPSCSRCSCSTPTARRWSAGSPACR